MVIEINNNVDGLFTMHSTPDTMPYLLCESNEGRYTEYACKRFFLDSDAYFSLQQTFFPNTGTSQHTTIANLALAQCATFVFKFKPTTKCRASVDVRIFVLHNLYETESLLLSAEGYIEDVTLDSTDENVFPVDVEEDLDPPPYHVNFGKQYVNHMTKRFFKVTNNSETDTFRYEWAASPHIDICPSIGHIRPQTSKETRIVVIPNAPVKLNKVPTGKHGVRGKKFF